MTSEARYWAFISYCHADAPVAARLHRALEGYVLPRRVRGSRALPRRLSPVFRDVDELAAGASLDARLRAALDQSRWLIVLCSPAAAASRYVDAEIRHFIGRHGRERVLCALVEESPALALPPAIRELGEEPLAADLRPGQDAATATLRLLATMAGVPYAELRDRDAQRRRHAQAAAGALALALLAGGLAAWDLLWREHVDHYAGYARHHGIWQGLDRLAPDAARIRASYRFVRRGRLGLPESVAYLREGACEPQGMSDFLGERPPVNHLGIPLRACRFFFEYGADGSLVREWADAESAVQHGTVIGQLTYTGRLAQALTYGGPGTSPKVHFVHFVRDAAGLDRQVRFLAAPGVPQANRFGHFGYAFDYDERGSPTRRILLDAQWREIP